MPGRRTPRIPGPVLDRIKELATDTVWTAGQIFQDIEQQFGQGAVSKRTVELWVKDLRPDQSDSWQVAGGDPDVVALMLDVRREVVTKTQGEVRQLSVAEAAWITRLHKAADGLSLYQLWLIARAYIRREARGETTGDLDYFLALKPWLGSEQWVAYVDLIDQNIIPSGDDVERWSNQLKEETNA